MTDASPTHFGIDMHLELTGSRPGRAIEGALREAITAGRLDAGHRLPATRTLAADLGVARATVADAYAQLTAEGWLEARTGAGTWVARTAAETADVTSVTAPRRPLREAAHAASLAAGLPDVSSFPRREWLAAARRALQIATDADLGYAPPAGVAPLRMELATYLRRARGVVTGPDGPLIGAGFGALLAELCRTLAESGARRVGVEAYGHVRHRDIVRAAGLELVTVPVDEEGAQVPSSAHIDALLLTPAHQFPLGVPLSAARRRALVAWARQTGALLIEDDYDGEFRYDRRSIGALQAVSSDSVAYLGTASKALGPAIGLAWAILPAHWHTAVLAARDVHGAARDVISQLTLAAFLREHAYDRQVRRMRAEYRRRRELLAALLLAAAPEATLSGVAAGLQTTVLLPHGSSAAAVAASAARDGVTLRTLTEYAVDDSATHPAAVVIGYSAPSRTRVDAELDAAVRAIASSSHAQAEPGNA